MTVKITQFKWEGRLGPFKIKTVCAECNLTKAVLENMKSKEFKDKDVQIEYKPWLNNFFYCIFRLTWHAPIIIVNGRKFHQFSEKDPMFDRKKLASYVLKRLEK